jgi:hydrogenase expression/formation protein HypD
VKYRDEYRDRHAAERLAAAIESTVTRPWSIMEVCGGQTHSIVKYGVDELLPDSLQLVHGPGCPVCVTPLEMIDRAHALAERSEVTLCSYGDMLRVPGSNGDLLERKARGADVRVVYSPLDAVSLAERLPRREIVFFAVGFETTAPANAMAVREARRRGLSNFSVLVSHVLTPPAIESILEDPECRVQGFLGPGHACTVSGLAEYEALARRYRVPIAITGFEPVDLLEGILLTVRRLEAGSFGIDNQYARSVTASGNLASRAVVDDVFEVCDRKWRGIGLLPKGGLGLRAEYGAFDALRRFELHALSTEEPSVCISGQVLRGLKKPSECPAFGKTCTPTSPLGATMVSSEGACAAYFAYRPALRGEKALG